MKSSLAVSALALLAASYLPVAAADLYGNSTKDASVSSGFLPSGAYLSIGAGSSLTDTGITQSGLSGADFNFSGFLGEARFGYDVRTPGSPWIIGAFGGVSYEGVGGKIKDYKPSSATPSTYTPASVVIVGSPTVTVGSQVIPLTNANANQYIGVGGTVPTGATLTVPTGSSVTYVPGSYTQETYTQSSYSTTDSNQGLGWEAGVRVGRVFNNTALLYGLVAYQGQQASTSINNTGLSTTLNGVKAGAGLEIDLQNHWFFGSEVDWVWYGDWNAPQQNVKFTEDELRATARIGYRF